MTKRIAFARDATGMVRELGVWDVFLISAAIATLQPNFLWLFPWPDPIFPVSSPFWICIFALAIPIGPVCIFSGASMPRSGGDCVYTSRTSGTVFDGLISPILSILAISHLGTGS